AVRVAGRVNRQAAEALQPAPYLDLEVLSALSQSSVQVEGRNLPPGVVRALVEKGVWSLSRALASARQPRPPRDRVDLLLYLVRLCTDDQQGRVIDEIKEGLALIRPSAERDERVLLLVALLRELGWLAEAGEVAGLVSEGQRQGEVLRGLVTHAW